MRQLCLALFVSICTGTIAFAQTPAPGERVLEFDFPSLHIGVAENPAGPTGTTVFYFPKGASATIDVRGGSPGTINSDVLRLAYDSSFVDAITIAGGSSYGLEVATGVASELRARRGNSGDWSDIAFVAGAIIFDLGPRRFNTTPPDKDLGIAALRAAQPGRFPLGARGAGRFAMQGGFFGGFEYRQHSGQGGAIRSLGATKVAVFTVVNSLGAIVGRDGRVVRCHRTEPTNAPCPLISDYIEDAVRRRGAPKVTRRGAFTENTTITVVVTNHNLDFWALNRLAVHVHSSMARAIQPFHTTNDGDVLFAVSTNEVTNNDLNVDVLAALASEAAWDAVLSSMPALPARAEQIVSVAPAVTERYLGTYEFAPGARLTISRGEGGQLVAEATGTRDVYLFTQKGRFDLQPVSTAEFISTNPRRDRLQFTNDGVVLNPGPWEMRARRVP
jgi:L-aminopeptidase/D-esterase-like protein